MHTNKQQALQRGSQWPTCTQATTILKHMTEISFRLLFRKYFLFFLEVLDIVKDVKNVCNWVNVTVVIIFKINIKVSDDSLTSPGENGVIW